MNFTGDSSFLQHPSIEEYKDYSGRVEIKLRTSPGMEPDAQPLLVEAVARGTRISRFEVTEPTLEEIFIEAVGGNVDA
jgi:ABC-2 type transport system ATP-binding protein